MKAGTMAMWVTQAEPGRPSRIIRREWCETWEEAGELLASWGLVPSNVSGFRLEGVSEDIEGRRLQQVLTKAILLIGQSGRVSMSAELEPDGSVRSVKLSGEVG